jgi:hypothetical protein
MNCGAELPINLSVIEGKFTEVFMRSILLWAIGIPIPIIILLWLVTGHA